MWREPQVLCLTAPLRRMARRAGDLRCPSQSSFGVFRPHLWSSHLSSLDFNGTPGTRLWPLACRRLLRFGVLLKRDNLIFLLPATVQPGTLLSVLWLWVES